MAGRTTIVIAHDQRTIEQADGVLHLEQGRVVAPFLNMAVAVSGLPRRACF